MSAERCVHTDEARAMKKCAPPCGKKSCPWCIVTRLTALKWLHEDVVAAARAVVEGHGDVDELRSALARLDTPKDEAAPAKDPRQKEMFDE